MMVTVRLEDMALEPGMRVLDLGCGRGRVSSPVTGYRIRILFNLLLRTVDRVRLASSIVGTNACRNDRASRVLEHLSLATNAGL